MENKNIGYVVTLWEDSSKSCPDCEGHVITNDLEILSEIYNCGFNGSSIGETKIINCKNLESFLDGDSKKYFRFHLEGPNGDYLKGVELNEIYESKKFDYVRSFSIKNLQENILPIFKLNY